MGVVYHANYLRYFEAGRVEYIRACGRPYAELERQGVLLPVIEAQVRYLLPARYDDVLRIHAAVQEARGARVRFAYRVVREGDLLAEGWTAHACIGENGRARRLPAELLALLLTGPAAP
jgi:acyl-CoA thioester hydrolase